jgi:hypothetical protein
MTSLFIRTWSTHEYGGGLDLGVVDLTDDVFDAVFRRHELFKGLKRKDSELRTISFQDDWCTYIAADVDDLVGKIGRTDVFDDQGWAIAPEGFALPEFEVQRIETARMELDATSVWWSCIPRYAEVDVMTERVAVVRLKELYAGKPSLGRVRLAASVAASPPSSRNIK